MRNLRLVVLVVVLAVLWVAQASAQALPGLPFGVPVPTKDRLLQALSRNERVTSTGGVLYVDADKIAAASPVRLGRDLNRQELIAYLASMPVRECPQGAEYSLDWIRGGEIVLDGPGERRLFVPDEQCLYDSDGKPVLSLRCINFIRGPVASAQQIITQPSVAAIDRTVSELLGESPSATATATATATSEEVGNDLEQDVLRRGRDPWPWIFRTVAVVVGGGLVYCGFIDEGHCRNRATAIARPVPNPNP